MKLMIFVAGLLTSNVIYFLITWHWFALVLIAGNVLTLFLVIRGIRLMRRIRLQTQMRIMTAGLIKRDVQ